MSNLICKDHPCQEVFSKYRIHFENGRQIAPFDVMNVRGGLYDHIGNSPCFDF